MALTFTVITFPLGAKSQDLLWHLCLTCWLLLTPSQNLLLQPSPLDFLYLFFSFCLQIFFFFFFFQLPLFHSAHWFTSKPDQLALDASLRAREGPVPPLVPWSLCRQRVRGAAVWRVGPQMDIDMSGMRYVMGLGSGLSGPATAVSHNSRRCWGFFPPFTGAWKECTDVISYNMMHIFGDNSCKVMHDSSLMPHLL